MVSSVSLSGDWRLKKSVISDWYGPKNVVMVWSLYIFTLNFQPAMSEIPTHAA